MFFKMLKEKRIAIRQPAREEVIVSVPDIKEYLLLEHEKNNDLKLVNEGLVQQLEKAKETELKYSAALVTIEEYSRRLKRAEEEIEMWKGRVDAAEQRAKAARDEVSSCRLKLIGADEKKKRDIEKIVEEIKAELALNFENHKGTLSKKAACEIIEAYEVG